MMMRFLDGFLIAMLPSIFMVAWLVWRATPADSDSDLNHALDKRD